MSPKLRSSLVTAATRKCYHILGWTEARLAHVQLHNRHEQLSKVQGSRSDKSDKNMRCQSKWDESTFFGKWQQHAACAAHNMIALNIRVVSLADRITRRVKALLASVGSTHMHTSRSTAHPGAKHARSPTGGACGAAAAQPLHAVRTPQQLQVPLQSSQAGTTPMSRLIHWSQHYCNIWDSREAWAHKACVGDHGWHQTCMQGYQHPQSESFLLYSHASNFNTTQNLPNNRLGSAQPHAHVQQLHVPCTMPPTHHHRPYM
jgi:hypothetical protein